LKGPDPICSGIGVPGGVSDRAQALGQRFPNPSPRAFGKLLRSVGDRYGFDEGMLPVSEDCSARTMALPFHARLERADQDRVVEALRSAL